MRVIQVKKVESPTIQAAASRQTCRTSPPGSPKLGGFALPLCLFYHIGKNKAIVTMHNGIVLNLLNINK